MMTTKGFSLIPDYGDINDPLVRAKYGYLEGKVSIFGNLLLFILKLTLGLFINSIALIADSVHTLSDIGTSLVVIVSFTISKKPSDTRHPFGYGRVEYIATVIIAVLLVVAGFGFIQQSIERILNLVSITNQQYAGVIGGIIIISAVVKEWMARFSKAIANKIKSDVLAADAWHHRSDALTNVAVGLSLIGTSLGFPYLDPVFGVIVALIIIYVGIMLGKTSAQFLIGKSPDIDLVRNVKKIGLDINGVKDIHDVALHDYGTRKIITLHAEVDKTLPLAEAHKIADILENKILETMHYSTIIHIEPAELHQDTFLKKRIIEDVLAKEKSVISFHNIHIIRRSEKDDISMHLVVDKQMNVQESHRLCHQLEAAIHKKYGLSDVHIHLEPCQDSYCPICSTPCEKKKIE